MSASNDTPKRAVIDVNGLLLVAFVVLKLCGVINWSWWWVLAPLWAPLLIFLVFMTITFFVMFIRDMIK